MKIRMRVEKIKFVEMSNEHQALQSAYQYLRQDFKMKRSDFVALRVENHRHATQCLKLASHLAYHRNKACLRPISMTTFGVMKNRQIWALIYKAQD